MAAISELIRTEENGKLSFGDYTLAAKAKLDNFEKDGDIYKVKTFKEITNSRQSTNDTIAKGKITNIKSIKGFSILVRPILLTIYTLHNLIAELL